MTRTVVDTNALLALLYPDDEHDRQAAEHLREAAERGALLIDPVVYAELAADPYFGSSEELEAFLDDIGVVLEDVARRALFDAGGRSGRTSTAGERRCSAASAVTGPCTRVPSATGESRRDSTSPLTS